MRVLFIIFLFSTSSLLSQTTIQGVVLDYNTKQPLPFATVKTNSNYVTLTDVDGNFIIETKKPFEKIIISYVGYKTIIIPVKPEDKFISITLKHSIENLNEVVVTAKENPALQLIRNAILNKPKNNIESTLNSFKFTAYNKLLVTANPDSISGKIDSVFIVKNNERKFHKLDSTNYNFKKEIVKQHLYISEKISEFQYQKGKKRNEKVLASRMAGLKQPVYELLAVTFQDFSFYNNNYTLAGTKYINPISKNAIKHYNYKILDTVSNGVSTSYMVYFKPKVKKEYLGIEGVLYLDTKSFAITKAIAELKGIVHVKATQNYRYIKNYNSWFPIERDIVLKKGTTSENMVLFGGMVKFYKGNTTDTIQSTAKNKPDDIIYFISKEVNSNIKINLPINIKNASSTITFDTNVANKPETFWKKFRTDSLSKRGENTYIYIDSIAKKEGVEKKIDLARNILKGYYPTKYLNLNLGKIINLNNYEGLRLGFGGTTNNNFSKYFKLESYLAYGTKDKDFKYSIGGSFKLKALSNTWIGANYTNDLKEAASLDFIAENTSFSPVNPRNLNIDKFYNYKTVTAFVKHDIQPNLETKLQISTGDYMPVFDYSFISPTNNLSKYKLTTATIGFQYNPFNEYMNSPIGKLTIKNQYPQFTLQLSKSFENVFDGNFNFLQSNVRIYHKIKRLRKATTTILIEGGIVFGEAPISHLFNATPNYTFKNPWTKRITFAGKNSFETMRYNEFISDRFSAIHIKHEFKPFKIGNRFKPQLTLATRAAIGGIKNPEYQNGLNFKSLNKGYLESGMEFNRLFKGFGLSSFYRYGAYQNSYWADNLAVKLTYKFSLGF